MSTIDKKVRLPEIPEIWHLRAKHRSSQYGTEKVRAFCKPRRVLKSGIALVRKSAIILRSSSITF
jgi:hypothetical protein